MAEVTVTVNGRSYTVGCGDGEESHVRDLAGFLDAQVRGLVAEVGQVGEARLLLMAAMMIIDDLGEAEARVKELGREVAALQAELAGADPTGDVTSEISHRLEAVISRLESA